MGNILLLDCTLRDGGYINNWKFGYKCINDIIKKLELTGIEMIEVGFIKGNYYDEDLTIFPDTQSFSKLLSNKNPYITYVGMLDMSSPVHRENITPCDGSSIDGIRVIFKKDKLNDAFSMCEYIKSLGYKVYVNFVSTDAYTDREFIDGIELFNSLNPDGVTIVDTFGTIKKKQFLHLLSIADYNLNPGIKLCYHAHNNLQQAFGNAESMVEMNMNRDIIIDACVFGMGRGAGNLNLELFAGFLNENYGKNYQISPILEIMDEYLDGFYKTKFWGYSLPLYLSALHGCHPNYAIYLAEKNSLSEKAFNELLQSIKNEDKYVFKEDKAEYYYKKYMDSYVNDMDALNALKKIFEGKKVLLIAPGNSLKEHIDEIKNKRNDYSIVLQVNFYEEKLLPDFVFAGNIRRFNKVMKDIENNSDVKVIATSNISDCFNSDYVLNYQSVIGRSNEVYDNSGLMALRFLANVGVRDVFIAGMDGFSDLESTNYYKTGFDSFHTKKYISKNELISYELNEIKKRINLTFITPTNYNID